MPQYIATAKTTVFGHELEKGATVALTASQAARFDKLKLTGKAVVPDDLEPDGGGSDDGSADQ